MHGAVRSDPAHEEIRIHGEALLRIAGDDGALKMNGWDGARSRRMMNALDVHKRSGS
ncbi:MAG: hypothetical protein JNL43_13480 [Flavobacteriales bacterium]|nr:hypothetical protein [Flavobacteriales bacterium]